MRLGGVEVSPRVTRSVVLLAAALAVVVTLVESFAAAVLFVTSLCFGAGIFSFILDICPDNLFPNVLPGIKGPKLHNLDCDLEKNRNEPWKDLKIPVEIDKALTELYEHILRDYVYHWYGEVSLDEEFLQEVRYALRYATAILIKRLGRLDLTVLITKKAIPIGLSHLDAFLHASEYANAFNIPVTDAYMQFVGHDIHEATYSREKEVLHIMNALKRVLPLLCPAKLLKSRLMQTLLRDIVYGAVLQPVLDILADPDIINYILEIAFDSDPAKKFPEATGEKVELLEMFVTSNQRRSTSTLHLDLSAILKNQQALFAFVQFLKEGEALNQLQFCLSIEDFNKRMMVPDLSEEELRSLHSEAVALYQLYLKPTASHGVRVSHQLAEEINKILKAPACNVIQLRTTTPMFKAYEEVYNKLEAMSPSFYKSEQYFTYLLGRRTTQKTEGVSKPRGSKAKKRSTNLAIPLVKVTSAPDQARRRMSVNVAEQNLPSEIDLTREMALEALNLHLSNKEHLMAPTAAVGRERSKSTDFGHPPTQVATLPLSSGARAATVLQPFMTLALVGQRVLRNPSTRLSRRSHLNQQADRDTADTLASATERIGKGFHKLRQGVLGKSMEGVADQLDPALDLADICPDAENSSIPCTSGLGELMEYRDLSSWRVSIPRVSTGQDGNGRKCFVFVVEVQRIDASTSANNDLQWVVERRYSEFYTLESKLSEFHGEFADCRLPPRAKLFAGKGLDVMQAKKQPFEEYLQCLLQKPALERSDLLFTFLTSADEFTVAASNMGLGKMLKNPIKLSKERSLQPFITSFIASTQQEPPKPRSDYAIRAEEYDIGLERPILPHTLFKDNLSVPQGPKFGHCYNYFKALPQREEQGVFDTLMYLAVNVFKMSPTKLNILAGVRILCRNTLDALVDYAVASKLSEVLCVLRVSSLCRLLEGVIFDKPVSRTDDGKELRKRQALSNFKSFLRPLLESVIGKDHYEGGMDLVFSGLQNPVINKQLAFVLLDTALEELFPEVMEKS